jgi:hypothetical protein
VDIPATPAPPPADTPLPPADAEASPNASTVDASTPDGLAAALSDLLRDAIPRRYEKKKDWERTKHITTGLKTEGSGLDMRIRRTKTEVKHGNWKHYRIETVDPGEQMDIRVENLHGVAPGKIAFTLFFTSQLEGWAQTRVYNRGVHIITLTAEGNTTLRLWLDCEVALSLTPSVLLTGVTVHPVVTAARLELDDFELTRISKLDGPLVHELGKGLRHVIEEELDGPTLVAKLNRAIDKKRDRLKFSPAELLQLNRLPVAKSAPVSGE